MGFDTDQRPFAGASHEIRGSVRRCRDNERMYGLPQKLAGRQTLILTRVTCQPYDHAGSLTHDDDRRCSLFAADDP